jgi:hypothetical protein
MCKKSANETAGKSGKYSENRKSAKVPIVICLLTLLVETSPSVHCTLSEDNLGNIVYTSILYSTGKYGLIHVNIDRRIQPHTHFANISGFQ